MTRSGYNSWPAGRNPHHDGGYRLYAFWDDPGSGDEPYAFFPERPLACLAAA